MSEPDGAGQATGCLVLIFMVIMIGVIAYGALYGTGVLK